MSSCILHVQKLSAAVVGRAIVDAGLDRHVEQSMMQRFHLHQGRAKTRPRDVRTALSFLLHPSHTLGVWLGVLGIDMGRFVCEMQRLRGVQLEAERVRMRGRRP